MTTGNRRLVILSGIDPTGGAGMALDLRIAHALGVSTACVPTCLTVQNRFGFVRGVPVAPALLREMLDAVHEDAPIGVVKVGLCVDATTVGAISDWLATLPSPAPPLVVDPVLAATAGGGPEHAVEVAAAIVTRLVPLGAIVTPNLPELAMLAGPPAVVGGVTTLLEAGASAVLVKGGHGEGLELVDVLHTRGASRAFRHPRLVRGPVHGTGCALASGIAARLARGVPLLAAVEQAIDQVAFWIARTGESADGRPVAIAIG